MFLVRFLRPTRTLFALVISATAGSCFVGPVGTATLWAPLHPHVCRITLHQRVCAKTDEKHTPIEGREKSLKKPGLPAYVKSPAKNLFPGLERRNVKSCRA